MTTALLDHAIVSPARPASAGRVAGSYLQPLLEAAAARGVAATDLARAAGLAADALDPLPAQLAATEYVRLLDVGAMLAADPHFGLHVGERVKVGTFSAYGLILLSCRDFGQAFEQTIRYEALAHDLGRSSLTVQGKLAAYSWHSRFPSRHRHLADSVFAGVRVFGNWLAGASLPAPQLSLTHDGGDPAGHDEYRRVFGALPRFGAPANIAHFDAALLACPVPNADVTLYPVLQRHVEQLLRQRDGEPDIIARVYDTIVGGLPHGQARLASVACQLQLTPRTLQRKLADAGTSFQRVLDEARFALARDYLARPGLSLLDITFLLGYQEQSAFNHAFREWAGINPGAWRERCGEDALAPPLRSSRP
ncbi:AraC family transcriptional regulator [Pseudoduganella armeniaca]|uniref:AraC family transcriptional regulator n=1 Tax=Pseudoduganella armeniaca TaxID=2072590 RepID=A0A2R4CDE0_9BURK|nr:AraC family transcriptional regulator [Pseudoduganella armeniaca]AVR97653.1 AraC family transcriptional regulator [Pseudoduganella armeniaca]